MSAHTVTAAPISFVNLPGSMKMGVVTLTLSASYDAGGSVADFSAAGFTTVHGAFLCDQTTAASSKYLPVFLHATADSPSTCLIKVHDLSQAADAEATGDLHTTVVRMFVIGS